MDLKFKKHQKVRLLRDPIEDDVEYYHEPPIPIKKGMTGKVNVILPNGQYHIDIIQDGETIAYVVMDEDSIEAVEALEE